MSIKLRKVLIGMSIIGILEVSVLSGVMGVSAYDTGHEDMSDEFTYEDGYYAFEKAEGINKKKLTRGYVGDPMKNKLYQPIVKVINGDTSAGYGKYGTGVIIDNYTYITNHHIVTGKGYKITNPSKVRIEIGREGSKVKKVISGKKIIVIPNRDVVIVKTSEKLSKYVKPMKIASSKDTQAIKPGVKLYTSGYGMYKGSSKRMTKTDAYFLRYSVNKTMGANKSLSIENGYSGSPVYDYRGQLVGIRSGVVDLEFWGDTETVTNDYYINGSVRSAIFKHKS